MKIWWGQKYGDLSEKPQISYPKNKYRKLPTFEIFHKIC